MKKSKKPRKTTRPHKRKTRHLRKSKRNFRLKTQRGGGPSDTYLLFVINCVRRYNRLTQYFSKVRLGTMEEYIYTRENRQEFRKWLDFEELFQNQDNMLTLFHEMRQELDKYKFGFLFNGTEEYTPEEASQVVQHINNQFQRIPSSGIVPIFETVQIERLFGDPNAKPVNNLRFREMQQYCKILKEAEDLFLQVTKEFSEQLPSLPSKNRV
jgi:hypothetical protein